MCYFCLILTKTGMWWYFLAQLEFHEVPFSGSEVVLCLQVDGWTDIANLIFTPQGFKCIRNMCRTIGILCSSSVTSVTDWGPHDQGSIPNRIRDFSFHPLHYRCHEKNLEHKYQELTFVILDLCLSKLIFMQ